jgi:putative phosphoribosyl transferase
VLRNVQSPTLLIVGGADQQVLALNEQAATLLTTTYEIQVVPGASHLFEEPGTLEAVSELAAGWFECHLGAAPKGS